MSYSATVVLRAIHYLRTVSHSCLAMAQRNFDETNSFCSNRALHMRLSRFQGGKELSDCVWHRRTRSRFFRGVSVPLGVSLLLANVPTIVCCSTRSGSGLVSPLMKLFSQTVVRPGAVHCAAVSAALRQLFNLICTGRCRKCQHR